MAGRTVNSDLRDAAFRCGVWQFIEQRAKEMKDAAKAELRSLEPGDAVQGKWHGQPVAKASMVRGRTKLVVTNEAVLLDWVINNHYYEVDSVVKPAYLKALERNAVDGVVIDNEGELVPGVEIREGDPYISVRKADGAEDVIAELFRTGAVHLDGITAAALPAVVDAAHLDTLPVVRWAEPDVKPEVKPEATDRYTQDMEAGAIG